MTAPARTFKSGSSHRAGLAWNIALAHRCERSLRAREGAEGNLDHERQHKWVKRSSEARRTRSARGAGGEQHGGSVFAACCIRLCEPEVSSNLRYSPRAAPLLADCTGAGWGGMRPDRSFNPCCAIPRLIPLRSMLTSPVFQYIA